MKTLMLSIIALAFSMTMTGCGNNQPAQEPSTSQPQQPTGKVETLDVQTCQTMIQEGKANVLDVRTPGEWNRGHLSAAQLMDFYQDNFRSEVDKLDKEQTYIVYCAVGGRSGEAAKMMHDMGFRHVINMAGGIEAWRSNNLPTVTD